MCKGGEIGDADSITPDPVLRFVASGARIGIGAE